MEFAEIVRRRRMVRNYDPDRPVPDEVRERILANAVHAPSAGFSQGWAFLVLEGGDRDRYWRTTAGDEPYDEWVRGLSRAPLLILAFAHKQGYLDRYAEPDKGWTDRDESRWSAPYWFIDTGMAVLLMLQTAVDAGLGACFFGVPADRIEAVRAEFGVPAAYAPIGVVSVGYPRPDRRSPSLRRGRREVPEVVHRGQWGSHNA
jgi:nitroreductase